MGDNEKDFKNGEPDLPTLKVTNLEILVKNVKKPEDFSGPLLPQQYIKRTLLIRLFHSNWHRNKIGTDIYSDIISFFNELKYFV